MIGNQQGLLTFVMEETFDWAFSTLASLSLTAIYS